MPGRPILRKMIADITKLGGDEWAHQRIADGDSVAVLANELGVSRNFLSGYLNRTPQLKQALIDARRSRADVHAEEALEIADSVPADPNEINKAKTRIDVRKWLAGIDDPERYGPKQQAVTVNVGALHLDALRKVQAELTISAPDVIEGQAEAVSDDED